MIEWITILSLVAGIVYMMLKIRGVLLDRPRISISAHLVPNFIIKNKEAAINVLISNIGRRVVIIYGLAVRWSGPHRKYINISSAGFPVSLKDGEFVDVSININEVGGYLSEGLYAYDSSNKYYKMKNSDFNQLFSEYKRYMDESRKR